MAQWKSFSFEVPSAIEDIINGLNSAIGPLTSVLSAIRTILNIVKVFILTLSDPLLAILEALIDEITELLNDLIQSGIYVLPVVPTDTYNLNNPKDKASKANQTLRYIRSISGGAQGFKSRVTNSFYDQGDPYRPQFSNNAKVGGVVLAFESGDLPTVLNALHGLYRMIEAEWKLLDEQPLLYSAKYITREEDNAKVVRLQWQLRLGFLPVGFKIQRSETDGGTKEEVTTTDNNGNTIVRLKRDEKGEVIGTYDEIASVPFTDYFVENFSVRGGKLYQYDDTTTEEGKSYFYRIQNTIVGTDYLGETSRQVNVSIPNTDTPEIPAIRIEGTVDGSNGFTFGENAGDKKTFKVCTDGKVFRTATLTNTTENGQVVPTPAEDVASSIQEQLTINTYLGSEIETVLVGVNNGKIYVSTTDPNDVSKIIIGNGTANDILGFGDGDSQWGQGRTNPPDWTRGAVIDIIPQLGELVKFIEKQLRGFLEGAQDHVDGIISFIDLLDAKIKYLQDLIDTLQRILNQITEILNLPQFHLLKIDPAVGGVQRFINEFNSAAGGPTTDANGYVIGLVFLVGGGKADEQYQALNIIF